MSSVLLYLTILSYFYTYGYQTNTNQIYFLAVHIFHRTPQEAHSSLSSSCSVISQALTEQSSHLLEHPTSVKQHNPSTLWIMSVFLSPPGSKQDLGGPLQTLMFVLHKRESRRHVSECSSQSCPGPCVKCCLGFSSVQMHVPYAVG